LLIIDDNNNLIAYLTPNNSMKINSKFLMSGLIMITLILGTSCDPSRKFEKEERERILEYVRKNNITITPTASGLYFIENTVGTGAYPVADDSVVVKYTGAFLDGTVFDSNVNTDPLGFTMGTGAVITGFEEGISYMKKGGKATLILPSSLAYGTTGNYWGNIPGYTPVLFSIELIKIIRPAGKK
jgi:FKBP-type peptidyl-prolyl cis-trans isomerase FkpA